MELLTLWLLRGNVATTKEITKAHNPPVSVVYLTVRDDVSAVTAEYKYSCGICSQCE